MVETPLAEEQPLAAVEAAADIEPVAVDKPKTRRRPRARKGDAQVEALAAEPAASADAAPEPVAVEAVESEVPVAPKRRSRAKKPAAPVETEVAGEPASAAVAESARIEPSNDQAPGQAGAANSDAEGNATDDDASGARRGWWQRTIG
jgi:ribonuclease E